MQTQTRTVRVGNISDLAGEREVREFFSFSGDIEHVDVQRFCEPGSRRTAFVTFKDPKALEIALFLSGATIVDQIVSVTSAENYTPKVEEEFVLGQVTNLTTVTHLGDNVPTIEARSSHGSGCINVTKAQEIVTSMLARGSAIRQDAVSKARAFDEKHNLTASASAKVISFDKRVGLSEKITVGITVVNEKMRSVDQRLQVSDKTMAALTVAERRLVNTSTTVKTNRYVTAGTAWLNGAFGKVAKVGHVAGMKTKEKFQLAVSNMSAKESIVAA
ncbi:uncharacterized protein A4U43_C01F33980 [Asparagus officinalis]|uniref:RRM domain-containing protein n=1 Tax=Asparagus officinalis TaxID=4686 RepID=A0A5P1FWB8_ASPOF|nr:binding partner of ACD11 1-like [Asparagus officinalis]ONK81897.1 uncharacterized protein A4U43_C01F33980 [Asparagus officinalis]